MNLKRRIGRMEERLPSGSGEHLIVDLTEGLPPHVERVPAEEAPTEEAPAAEAGSITVELVGANE